MEGSSLNKSQSKYYNTACFMDEALIALLERKNYEYITVKEICEKAGVNRSTFYLHYETIDDLLSECIEYIGKKIVLKYRDKNVICKKELSECSLEELIFITPEYLIPYLDFVKENRNIFTAAVSQPKALKTIAISDYLFAEIFKPVLDRYAVPDDEQEYRIAFYLNGIWAIVSKWAVNGCKEETVYISNLIMECIGLRISNENQY